MGCVSQKNCKLKYIVRPIETIGAMINLGLRCFLGNGALIALFLTNTQPFASQYIIDGLELWITRDGKLESVTWTRVALKSHK